MQQVTGPRMEGFLQGRSAQPTDGYTDLVFLKLSMACVLNIKVKGTIFDHKMVKIALSTAALNLDVGHLQELISFAYYTSSSDQCTG